MCVKPTLSSSWARKTRSMNVDEKNVLSRLKHYMLHKINLGEFFVCLYWVIYIF